MVDSHQAWRRPWIKLWVEMLEDPKVVVTLGQAQRWVWIGLLLATTRSPEPGRMLLPNGRPMSVRQLRQVTRSDDMSNEEFEETLKSMESLRMVQWEGEALTISRWNERQDPETPAQRMKRYRERNRAGNGQPQGGLDVTTPVTKRHGEGNAPGTLDQPLLAPVPEPVTQRNAEAPQVVTEAVTERNEAPSEPASGEAVTETVTKSNTRIREGKRGGASPHQKTRREEDTPSGAKAPSGAAPTFLANSNPGFQELGSAGSGEEISAAAERLEQDSSPPSASSGQATGDGGGTAPRLRNNGEQDSRPESAGGEEAAPRRMSGRRKTGGNPQVDGVLKSIEDLWGQPIVHWAKEAREVKAALTRGYAPDQVVACWKAAQDSPRWQGRWMPLAFLVEDLGEFVKNGCGPLRKWGQIGKEEVRAANSSPLPTAEEWRKRRGRW